MFFLLLTTFLFCSNSLAANIDIHQACYYDTEEILKFIDKFPEIKTEENRVLLIKALNNHPNHRLFIAKESQKKSFDLSFNSDISTSVDFSPEITPPLLKRFDSLALSSEAVSPQKSCALTELASPISPHLFYDYDDSPLDPYNENEILGFILVNIDRDIAEIDILVFKQNMNIRSPRKQKMCLREVLIFETLAFIKKYTNPGIQTCITWLEKSDTESCFFYESLGFRRTLTSKENYINWLCYKLNNLK